MLPRRTYSDPNHAADDEGHTRQYNAGRLALGDLRSSLRASPAGLGEYPVAANQKQACSFLNTGLTG